MANFWRQPLSVAPGPGAALASSAALTDVSPSCIIPAGSLWVGQKLSIKATGMFSNTATPTLTFGAYWGGVAGVALAATGAITTVTAATNWPWILDLLLDVRSIGATGTVFCSGSLLMPASLTQFQAAYAVPAAFAATVAIDTTSAKLLSIGAKWSAASLSNTLQCQTALFETAA